MRAADRTEWGCSCGRLCLPEDDECESCNAPRSAGTPLPTLSARNRFTQRAAKVDRRVLETAKGKLDAVETSYRATSNEFDAHAREGFYGHLMPFLEGSKNEYGDVFAEFYRDADYDAPWVWG